jgi:hypothetical protein
MVIQTVVVYRKSLMLIEWFWNFAHLSGFLEC